MRRSGFSLLELVVSIAIIAILMALLLPAVQHARESGRRTQCRSNLHQLAVATQQHIAMHGIFPPANAGTGGHSVLVRLLPYLDQRRLYETWIALPLFSQTPEQLAQFREASKVVLPSLICSSDPFADRVLLGNAASSYAGNHGTGVKWRGFDGVIVPVGDRYGKWDRPAITPASIRDGLSQTAAFAEILVAAEVRQRLRIIWNAPSQTDDEQFATACATLSGATGANGNARGRPWASGQIHNTGYVHILPPNRPNCFQGGAVQEGAYSAGSEHRGGCHVLFADGHLQFINESVSELVWRRLGSRSGQ